MIILTPSGDAIDEMVLLAAFMNKKECLDPVFHDSSFIDTTDYLESRRYTGIVEKYKSIEESISSLMDLYENQYNQLCLLITDETILEMVITFIAEKQLRIDNSLVLFHTEDNKVITDKIVKFDNYLLNGRIWDEISVNMHYIARRVRKHKELL